MSDTVRIEVTPSEPLFDRVVDVTVEGAAPGQHVTVAAEMVFDGRRWRSEATYEASPEGEVSTASSRSISGSYDGVQQMGLFQHVEPIRREEQPDPWVAPVELTARCGDDTATATVSRRLKRPDVSVTAVDHEDIVGRLFAPETSEQYRPVLFVDGIEPGIPDALVPPLLASRGHPVLSLAYYGVEDLPNTLAGIPVEYMQTAGRWLVDRCGDDEDELAVFGRGRGADIGFFLGAYLDEVDTVVAYNGSGVLFQGVPGGFREPPSMLTHGGEPLPCVHGQPGLRQMLGAIRCRITGDALALRPLFEAAFDAASEDVLEDATVPVESVGGDVLVVTGEDDRTRNTPALAAVAERRLENATDTASEHHTFADAGYDIRAPYQPTTDRDAGGTVLFGIPAAFGGSPEGYATADEVAWSAAIDCLQRSARPVSAERE